MPELPEVEDAARRLRAAMSGHVIVAADAFHPSTAKSLTPEASRRLAGQRVLSVERRAKIQLVHLSDGHLLEVHFRMTGDWNFGPAHDAPQPLERARFTLDNGTRVSFIDGRAFGVLRLHAPGAFSLPLLGPEPLEEAFDAAVLHHALAAKRGPIKPVLLDQRVVAGLGNIYAAEALWEARIHPERVANTLSRVRVGRLRDAIQLVLRDAPVGRYYARANEPRVDKAGVNDDVENVGVDDAEHDDEHWRVYGREGEPCRRCSSRIVRIVQSGRSTFYCRRCQR
jgi:formamidopyrimidine-DNA glycosylase